MYPKVLNRKTVDQCYTYNTKTREGKWVFDSLPPDSRNLITKTEALMLKPKTPFSWKLWNDKAPVAWNVAKVFMMAEYKENKDSEGPDDVDIPPLANIMGNCTLFTNVTKKLGTDATDHASRAIFYNRC